jgi:HK97 family phage major capsid protein
MHQIKNMLTEIGQGVEGMGKRLDHVESQLRTRKWASVPGLEMEKDRFSLCRVFGAIKTGNWGKAGFEEEVFRNTRAMSTGDDSSGGYMVPVQAMPEFIEMLREEAVCIRMGARHLTGLVGAPVTFAKQTGGATFCWTGENKEIEASMLNVGQLRMVPRKCAALIPVSNELIRMANPDAENMVRQDLAQGASLALDRAALRGPGSENQPLGIANTVGINIVILGTGAGAVPDFSNPFTDMEGELADAKALRGSLGYIFHPKILRVLKKLRNPYFSGDTGGEYPMLPLTNKLISEIFGYPFATTTELPVDLVAGGSINCTEIFFGNWQELLIGQWQGFEILASNVAGTAFAFDQTWVRCLMSIDIGLRHPESFCLCNTARIAAS